MARSSLSLNLARVLSLSFSSSSPSHSHRFLHSRSSINSQSSASVSSPSVSFATPKPNASASDLLSLLGTEEQALKVDPKIAMELKSCLKFLAPFYHSDFKFESKKFSVSRTITSGMNCSDEDDLVQRPPPPVLELARLVLDSGGDPGSIHRTLDPAVIPVPDIEGSMDYKCELTRTSYGRRFISQEVNSYLQFLFQLIESRGPRVGLNVSLNRYDLFHGHLFVAYESRRLGILFHAKEYPSYDKEVFPYNMGYCQLGSDVQFDDTINLRNILWVAPLPGESGESWIAPGVLLVLDAHPGGIVYSDFVPHYVDFVRTIYEDYFGDVVVDVNYLKVKNGAIPEYQIFIC